MNISTEERFLRYVDLDTEHDEGCCIWTGGTTGGYGKFKLKGKNVPAHRMSFLLFKGPIPAGLFVCHSCDTPLCVNPEHLFLGTHEDNMRDMILKGRVNTVNRKLTKIDVLQIRSLIEQGVSERKIAALFNIHQGTVHSIKTYRIWNK